MKLDKRMYSVLDSDFSGMTTLLDDQNSRTLPFFFIKQIFNEYMPNVWIF